MGTADGIADSRMQRAHVPGVDRVAGGRVRDAGKGLDVDQRRHQRCPVLDHHLDGLVGQAGAVFDAVDACRDQSGERVFPEDVRGDACPFRMGRGNGVDEDRVVPEGPEVSHRAVDPVTDELDPPVAESRLLRHRLGKL